MAPDPDDVPELLSVSGILERSLTQSGDNIADLSCSSPVLLVFLRHAGCSFCRESLLDIAHARRAIECRGTRIVLVHMGDVREMEALFFRYELSGLDRICDPDRNLYNAFGIRRGTLRQLLGITVLWRGLYRGVLVRHGIGRASADPFQIAALFLLHNARIVRRFRHRTIADRPDYLAFCADTGSKSE